MKTAEPKDFTGTWTIYEVGSATWATRLEFGAQFELLEKPAGSLTIKIGRGFKQNMKKFNNQQLEPPQEGTDPIPAKFTAFFPDISRTVVFQVTKKGAGREISVSSGDEGDGKNDEVRVLTHGGPHGTDN